MTDTASGLRDARNVVFSLLQKIVRDSILDPGLTLLLPCVADANDMVNIAETEFEQLVGHDACGITEAKQAVVREDSMQTHRPGM
jgi:hypothetical protein